MGIFKCNFYKILIKNLNYKFFQNNKAGGDSYVDDMYDELKAAKLI